MKAGEKSFNRYALDEAHQYYKEAFGLLSEGTDIDKSIEYKTLFVDILIQWSQVYYRRSLFLELSELLTENENLALSLGDKARLGMYYVRQGGALIFMQELKRAYQYLKQALGIGKEINDQRIIGFSCGFLTWCCADLGLLDEAAEFEKIILSLNLSNTSDQELFRYASWGLGEMYWIRGEATKAKNIGNKILIYAQQHSNMACMSDGNLMVAIGNITAGDYSSAIDYARKAADLALEPMLLVGSKSVLGLPLVGSGRYVEAEKVLKEAQEIATNSGHEYVIKPIRLFSGIVTVTKGNLNQGIRMIEEAVQGFLKDQHRWRYALGNYLLGQIYLQIIQGAGEKSFSFIAKNIGFLITTVPFAQKKAEEHLNNAIQTAKEIGAKSILAQAYLDMGRLRQAKGRTDEARKYMSEAILLFEECEADVFLKQAREAFAALG
jgi:tetratricopeptide (TPR) repeat protein